MLCLIKPNIWEFVVRRSCVALIHVTETSLLFCDNETSWLHLCKVSIISGLLPQLLPVSICETPSPKLLLIQLKTRRFFRWKGDRSLGPASNKNPSPVRHINLPVLKMELVVSSPRTACNKVAFRGHLYIAVTSSPLLFHGSTVNRVFPLSVDSKFERRLCAQLMKCIYTPMFVPFRFASFRWNFQGFWSVNVEVVMSFSCGLSRGMDRQC